MQDGYEPVLSFDFEKSYRIEFDNNEEIHISFAPITYAISFFCHGSEIQNLLEDRKYKNTDVSKYNKVIIDLSEVTWFDTLALCYLILFMYDAKAKYQERQLFGFVPPQDDDFGAFLLHNGFIDHFEALSNQINDEEKNEWSGKSYSKVHECAIKFTVFSSRDEIADTLSSIRLVIENAYSYISPERLNRLVNKIMYFLNETLENVYDHAYSANTGRSGLLIKSVKCSSGIDYHKYAKDYTSKTPYIKINIFENIDAFLEIYVMDTGCGIKRSFDPKSEMSDKNIIDYIFDEGRRSYKKVSGAVTKYGGLHDIRDLFNQDLDALGIKSDSIWKFVYKSSDQKFILINPQVRETVLRTDGKIEGLIHGFALVASVNLGQTTLSSVEPSDELLKASSQIIDELFSTKEIRHLIASTYIIDERWNPFVETDWSGGKSGITVIYPQVTTTKQWIIQKINSHKNSDSIIFTEVPDSDIKLFSTNIVGLTTNLKTVKTKKIIVVTKSLNVAVFVRNKNEDLYFVDSKEKAAEFIHASCANSSTIAESLTALLIFDKYYNTKVFWDTIQRFKGASYIPQYVQWDEKSEWKLRGYIDFSQVSKITECREICIQKLNELRILTNSSFYNSVDRFTDEICDRANFLIGAKRDGKHLNIGSVFVSGTSNRLLTGDDECFFFLCHPDSKSQNRKTLLMWPKSVVEEVESDNQNPIVYHRFGNSSFIAQGGAAYWLKKHEIKVDTAIRLDNVTLYKLLQRKIGVHPDTLKIGHFESTERHDFFGYRVNNWFDADTVDRQLKPNYERDSVYDFLITDFIYSIYGKITKESVIKLLNDSLSEAKKMSIWSKYFQAAKNDKLPSKPQKGVVVYFSDFQTSMIIEKIERCFSNDVLKSIIPLIPITRTYEMGSLIVSPIVLDRIAEYITGYKEHGEDVVVTVFDAVVFNVRLIEEVKQILYGIGASKVRILTVLDRRRIPVTELMPSMKALGRVDSPALDGNGICSTCRALEKLNKYKDCILNPDLKNRMGTIISRWQCIQLSENDYLKGLDSNHITLTDEARAIIKGFFGEYLNDAFEIILDSALCSLVVEYTVISSSAQLFIDLLKADQLLINEKESISSEELKILLASTYLLLFATNPTTIKEASSVVNELRKLLDSQHNFTSYSGLAVIAISSLSDDFVNSLGDQYDQIERDRNTTDYKAINEDALIARIVSFLSLENTEFCSSHFSLERKMRCYLVGNQSKIECLYDVFLISEKLYRNSHRHAFGRIIDNAGVDDRDYQDALEYTRKLKHYVNDDAVFASLFHNRETLPKEREVILGKIGNAYKNLDAIVKERKEESRKENNHEMIVRKAVNSLAQGMESLNRKWLYLRTAASAESNDYREIIEWLTYCKDVAKTRVPQSERNNFLFEVQKNFSNGAFSNLESSDTRPWFYSFDDITEEVINLMGDMMKYGADKTRMGNEEYDGVVKVFYKEAYVEISFVNMSEKTKDIDSIRKIKQSKANRDSLLVFKDLQKMLEDTGLSCFDFSLSPIEDSKNQLSIFKAVMRIPYITRFSVN